MKGSRLPLKWSCLLLLALTFSGAIAQVPEALREKGVLYFDGNLPDKITATLHAATTVYTENNFDMAIATLYPGQQVELVGMSPEGYLLKTTFRNNTLNGWIKPADLPSGIDPALFDLAKKNQARRDAVADAIAKKTVIQGMTTDEVQQAVGKPAQVSSHTDAAGSSLTWIYTTYRDEIRYAQSQDVYGRPFSYSYTVQVPTGQMIIDFTGTVVTSITQHKTDSDSPGIQSN